MNVTIIADASHCHRTGAAGYGFWAVSERGRHAGSGAFREPVPSSEAAECMAVVNALHVALAMGIAAPRDRVLVQTDCLAAIEHFRGIRRRTPEPVKPALSRYRAVVGNNYLTVEFRHVRGHTSDRARRSVAQRRSDSRAKAAMRKARATKEVPT